MSITTYAELQTSVAKEISYNPKNGSFHWEKSGSGRAKRAGAEAGCVRPDGYKSIKINGKQWLCHRLAWVMFYGTKPPRVIDHIDRDKGNNAISNLRDGTNGVNEFNAKAHKDSPFGISGIRVQKRNGHFQAYVGRRKDGFKSLYHGPDFFEACCARKSWEANYWGNVK